MKHLGLCIAAVVALALLPMPAHACRTAAQMRSFLFSSDPGPAEGAVAARVEIVSEGWSAAHPEIRARVIKLLRGSRTAPVLRLVPAHVSTCDLVPRSGETGVVAGRLISASRGELVIAPSRGPAHPPNGGDRRSCSSDGLIHAEVGPEIDRHVTDVVRLLEKGARLREAARLDLPCGFRVDPHTGWNVVLTNGSEFRRYAENNPFGFAPAYGFGQAAAKPYTLSPSPVPPDKLSSDDCVARLKGMETDLQLCSSFASRTALFATSREGPTTRLAHYVWRGDKPERDFDVADIAGHVESIFFLPPPDALGGTITILLSDDGGLYRVFLDTPRG